jgi:uncharacterized protein (TIGR00255 family)
MTMKSMTGHGCGEAAAHGVKVEVELSAVNRKQFDFRVSLPRHLASLESRLHAYVHKHLSRGSINGVVRVNACREGIGSRVQINEELAAAYVKALRKTGKALGIDGTLSLDTLATLPDVIGYDDAADDTEAVWKLIRRALVSAVDSLVAMRTTEGALLEKDLIKRFKRLQRRHAQITKHAPSVAKHHHAALVKRIAELEIEISSDDPQVIREIALFADKCDISEELVRLGSHFHQVDALMKKRDPVGRSFDFLCQEILREINTIGSKANHGKLSEYVIEFKAELERIREQVQNIE